MQTQLEQLCTYAGSQKATKARSIEAKENTIFHCHTYIQAKHHPPCPPHHHRSDSSSSSASSG
eukprot:11678267-Ditylum_brightwellii.AAC.1